MKEYNLFAQYHDLIVRPDYDQLDDEVFFLNEVFEDFWNWKHILEAACWSWVVMKELINKWYDVKGFDLSEQMIKKSKDFYWLENTFVWDMRTYNSDEEFDIVLCNYNSICHLLTFEDWVSFFKASYNNLKSWWILVFDITTIYEFESLVEDFTLSKEIWDDTLCLSVEKRDSSYVRNVKMFQQAEDWRFDLFNETVSEASFEIEKIKTELENYFKIETIVDYHNIEISEFSERVYFVARKI